MYSGNRDDSELTVQSELLQECIWRECGRGCVVRETVCIE